MKRAEGSINVLLFLLNTYVRRYFKPRHTAQYQNFPSAIVLVLLSVDLRAPRPLETWSVDDENESDVKCNHEARHGLLTGNQYDVDPLSEPTCS
jgi:hypothetical protein